MEKSIKKYAIRVFQEEAASILNLVNYLDFNFEQAIIAILDSSGRVIVTGMGKSGIIAKKLSTTLASTGTSSFFLHPAEAFHGDLGMINKEDIIIAITNSGETDEILKIVPFIRENGNVLISITGNPFSTLAKNSDYHLNSHVDKEVCPLNLTPTSSSTTANVMGDAIVVALMSERNFQPHDYARFHPGGNLGRRLLTRAKDLMIKSDLPVIESNSSVIDVIYSISNGGLGLTVVLDEEKSIIGIITDGDIRRAMQINQNKFLTIKAKDVINKKPIMLSQDDLFSVVEKTFREKNINSVIIAENNKLIGVIPYKKIYEKI